jgi:hypothetical protein
VDEFVRAGVRELSPEQREGGHCGTCGRGESGCRAAGDGWPATVDQRLLYRRGSGKGRSWPSLI